MPQVESALARMWAVERTESTQDALPSEFRASQMNLILHFGPETDSNEGNDIFQTTLKFAQRYPCRIVVLCPGEEGQADPFRQAKVYSQCFVGRNLRDRTCCDVLMLRYDPSELDFLDSMVSIWLENDLPTSYYFHKVPLAQIEAHLLEFVRKCRRVLFDASVETEDLSSVQWPHAELVRDLAWARLLPLRQALGQFLSNIETAALCEGLESVKIAAHETLKGEGSNLLAWVRQCLEGCAQLCDKPFEIDFSQREAGVEEPHMSMEWAYRDSAKHLLWSWDRTKDAATITADFGNGRTSFPIHASFLSTHKTLAEACFFD